VRLASLLVIALGCSQPAARPTAPPSPAAGDDAAAGVTDPRLADLLRRHWEHLLAEAPVLATQLGDRRFDDRLRDASLPHHEEVVRATRRFLDEARALPPDSLGEADRETLAMFTFELDSRLASEVCAFETWQVGIGANPLTELATLPDDHAVASDVDRRNLLARYRQIPKLVDDTIAALEVGVRAGRASDAESIRRVIAMYDGELAKPARAWPLVTGAGGGKDPALAREAEALVDGPIRAAYARYRAFLATRVLPIARGGERVGLSWLGLDPGCYPAQIRLHTTLPRRAEELHELGRAEIARINGEMSALGQKLFGTSALPEILRRLRTDKALYFATEDEVEATARRALAAAQARAPQFFGTLPKADCVVRRVPDFQAPFTTIAYYRQPNLGTKPGEYFVNVLAPETRPRYEAEALAFHEAVPGHHLQIAISQELPALPAFRRHGGGTAFIEGWALYTERLADEMGLYSGDLDRMGMLSYDAWRASRLVVDTGLHALGWSREQAVAYMLAHTALAENNIRNEVDRYIGWPGQALAYKVGQLTIRELRAEAERRLGPRFDLKAFHDRVLSGSGVTMELLQARVRAWIAEREKA
jgi:uncharacterized protein (DUF885 family)